MSKEATGSRRLFVIGGIAAASAGAVAVGIYGADAVGDYLGRAMGRTTEEVPDLTEKDFFEQKIGQYVNESADPAFFEHMHKDLAKWKPRWPGTNEPFFVSQDRGDPQRHVIRYTPRLQLTERGRHDTILMHMSAPGDFYIDMAVNEDTSVNWEGTATRLSPEAGMQAADKYFKVPEYNKSLPWKGGDNPFKATPTDPKDPNNRVLYTVGVDLNVGVIHLGVKDNPFLKHTTS